MTAPVIRGWCPGALRPMASGDGLVVRLRPPLGRLTPEQARGIADLSRKYGNGRLDLSARANLQLRGIGEGDHPGLIAALRDLALVDETPEAEARRNITVTPFHEDGDDTATIATALATALATSDLALPSKFGFAVDCGPRPVLTTTSADIRIEHGATGLILRADGAGEGTPVTPTTAVPAALNLAQWFLASGGAPEGRGRMARHLATGAELPARFSGTPAMAGDPPPTPGPTPQGRLAGFAFGEITADHLTALATQGPLRLTPWRMILVEGATSPLNIPGVIETEDPLLRTLACRGAPDCPQGLSATRSLARALAKTLAPGTTLHVAGCAKGCAHPGPATRTLTATGPDRFDLVKNGRAGDIPARTGLSADALIRDPIHLTGPA